MGGGIFAGPEKAWQGGEERPSGGLIRNYKKQIRGRRHGRRPCCPRVGGMVRDAAAFRLQGLVLAGAMLVRAGSAAWTVGRSVCNIHLPRSTWCQHAPSTPPVGGGVQNPRIFEAQAISQTPLKLFSTRKNMVKAEGSYLFSLCRGGIHKIENHQILKQQKFRTTQF